MGNPGMITKTGVIFRSLVLTRNVKEKINIFLVPLFFSPETFELHYDLMCVVFVEWTWQDKGTISAASSREKAGCNI